MKKLILACSAIVLSIGAFAQVDSTGNRTANPTMNSSPTMTPNKESDGDMRMKQHPTMNNTAPQQNDDRQLNTRDQRDTTSMHKIHHGNTSHADSMHHATPARAPHTTTHTAPVATPAKTPAHTTPKPKKDEMYLVPDSAVKK